MHLTSLLAVNFRSYKDGFQLEFKKPITVLIGRNNSGKSNILELVRWIREMATGTSRSFLEQFHSSTQRNNQAVMGADMVFELGGDDRNELLGIFTFPDHAVKNYLANSAFLKALRIAFRFRTNGILSEKIDVSNVTGPWLPLFEKSQDGGTTLTSASDLDAAIKSFRSGDLGPQFSLVNRQSGSGPPILNYGGLTPLMTNVRSMIASILARQVSISPERKPAPANDPAQDYVVAPTGANLARVLNTIQGDNRQQFDGIMSEVQEVIPGLTTITAPLRGNQTTIRVQEPGGVDVTLGNTSDGIRQSLTIAGTLLTSQSALCLVEEPELNMHASAQRKLLLLMKKLAHERSMQFLITTHSTIFAKVDNDVATWIVTKNNGVSQIRELENTGALRLLKSELGHENTDFFGWNIVLVTEGESEEVALPILAESQGLDLESIGVRIYNVRGTGRATKIESLLQYLKDSATDVYIMLDAHGQIKQHVEEWSKKGLVPKDHLIISDPEFEDSFDDETILTALSQYAKEDNIEIDINKSQLESARKTARPISKLLQQAIYEKNQRSLDKPLLAELLANSAIENKTVPKEIVETLNMLAAHPAKQTQS